MPFTFSPLPHKTAVSRIAGLPLVTREVMDGLLPELRAYAFCVTGLDGFDQLAKVRDVIGAVPAGEKTWAKARKEIASELVDDLGGKASQRRAELLLRTHVFRSYAAARYRNLIQQVDVFPYWQYKTHGDGNVRPSHAALNGKIFPAGHEIWQRIFPPWDWGCRCLVVPLTQRSAEAVLQRGKISEAAAKDANLLPTQIAKPEMFTAEQASIIDKNQRLPGGIPLNRTPTWADSPWSEPGSVHHDWQLIEKRYSDAPETLATFREWADKTEIEKGTTVSMWLDDVKAVARSAAAASGKPVKAGAKAVAVAADGPRTMPTINKALQVQADELKTLKTDLSRLRAARDVARMRGNDALTAELADQAAAKELQISTSIDQARAACSIPTAERGILSTEGVPAEVAKQARAGADLAAQYTHRKLLPKIQFGATTKDRAFYDHDDATARLSLDSPESIVLHEITHGTEVQNPGLLAKSLAFLKKRASSGPLKPLSELTGDTRYDANELAWEDEWVKRGGDVYAGKTYWGKHTEILTMGVERLHRNPVEFWENDREYFTFVVQTLQQV